MTPDADLAGALRRRDPGAAEQLVERYGDRIYRLDEQAMRDMARDVLSEAIGALPDEYRPAFVLLDVGRLSKHDVAQILGVEPTAATLRLHRARLFVGTRLSEHFETVSTPDTGSAQRVADEC